MRTYLFFWDVKNSKVFSAFLRMATGHFFLKFNKSVTFYKLLGTGKGETFIPRDANKNRWGLLVVTNVDINSLRVIKSWRKIAHKERYFELSAISSLGVWAKKQPFEISELRDPASNIAVITRAKIRFKLSRLFWKSVPPVVVDLKSAPGLIWAIGIGESPFALQGTFSIWENEKCVKDFAYKGQAHTKVIKQTRDLNWYSEELFARFEVLAKAE